MVLLFKAEQSFTVRILDQEAQCEQITRHVYKRGKTFMKSLCLGGMECPYCQVNEQPMYTELPPAEKPYPQGNELVKPVYVYELKAIMLLSGWDVWQTIEQMRKDKGSVVDRDLKITRNDAGRITYNVNDSNPAQFTVDISQLHVPTAEEYRNFLRAVKLPGVSATLPTASAPAAPAPDAAPATAPTTASAPAAPASAPLVPPATAPAQPAAPPPPAGSERQHSQESANKWLDIVKSAGFNSGKVDEAMKSINPAKKKINEFNDDEIARLCVEYQMKMAGQA
jgi:hypothetical protein